MKRIKRLILNCAGILAIIAVVLSMFDLHGAYDVERTLWRINRDFAEMSKHPESAPEFGIEELAERYRTLIREHPKSLWAARAQMMLGNVYLFKQDYARAREEFQKVGHMDDEDKELLAQAKTAVASSYLSQGKWNNALEEYKQVVTDYPLTTSGFTTPIRIGKYYEIKGLKKQAARAYEEAAIFYQQTAKNNPRSIVEYNSLQYLIICRIAQKRWSEAVETSRQLIMQYPTGDATPRALKIINVVCVNQLRDYNLAIGILNQFMSKYPNHAAVENIKKMLAGLSSALNKTNSDFPVKP